MIKKIPVFFRLSKTEKKLFLLALYYSAIARFVVVFIPFRKYSNWLGKYGVELPELSYKETDELIMIARAIQRASKITPWRNKCLEQAITAKKILTRKKISSTIYFGLKKENNKTDAHAWLRVGNYYVTGGKTKDLFTIVAYFSS